MTMAEVPMLERVQVTYNPTYQRFALQQKSFHQQYSHIYVTRLTMLRPTIHQAIENDESAASVPILSKIIDVRDGENDCILIGTALKLLQAKPCLFDALTSDEKIISLTAMQQQLATASDELVLEDESGRVELDGSIAIAEVVTGVVLGVRGRLSSVKKGVFHVSHVYYPEFAPQSPLASRMITNASRFVALVSGLSIGRNPAMSPLKTHLLMDYLAGRIGNDDEKQFVTSIVRTIVAGNSVVDTSNGNSSSYTLHTKKNTAQELTMDAMPMRNLDELLATLASTMCVDIMPGETDPSNYTLPQQRFHPCLFPRSSRLDSFRTVTNPYEAQIDGVQFLGSAGQPTQSLLQCTFGHDKEEASALDGMERCLRWRHMAPTAPDLLPCFPMAHDDPFVLASCPHVFFSGNHKTFQTRLVTGPTQQSVRLVCVPSFADTSTIVLVDLNDLACFPITLDLP